MAFQFGRGAKKELRSATATTAEMTGRLNLRVMHGGAATLHSIRVMQPKQVSCSPRHRAPPCPARLSPYDATGELSPISFEALVTSG